MCGESIGRQWFLLIEDQLCGILMFSLIFPLCAVNKHHRWLGARLQRLQCISNGVAAVYHQAIDIVSNKMKSQYAHVLSLLCITCLSVIVDDTNETYNPAGIAL